MGSRQGDDDAPIKKIVHEIGQKLDELSVAELDARILSLNEEIARLETARNAKQQSREAASAFFKAPG